MCAHPRILSFVAKALADRKDVTITGFGTFKAKETKPTTKHNPRTMEPVAVPARWKAKFRASTTILSKWVETGVKPGVKSGDNEKASDKEEE